MSDRIDRAQERAEQHLAHALRYRKPVSTRCEACGDAVAVLPNGARARFCDDHLTEFLAERASHD
jgi:hypothetical protein